MQKYEKYWSLTLAYTDIHSSKFGNTLKAIVEFINQNTSRAIDDEFYDDLQRYVSCSNGLEKTSLRKSINQFVKLGFINNLKSYNRETIDFLNAKTKKKRQTIFSEIVYKYSTFSSSITKYVEQKEINFLLKTLEEVGDLTKDNISGLMTVDITSYTKGYLNSNELNSYTKQAIASGFIKRKYNQIRYLLNLLKKLDDIIFVDDKLYFEEDAKIIFGDSHKQKSRKRDGYLHRLYKNQLKNEVEEKLNNIKCMVEKLSYPSLVASHIKPFIDSNNDQAYDPNNGLLLSRNFDILFDQGYITFNKKGKIICSEKLEDDVINHIKNYKLDKIFINKKRIDYLKYHKKNIFKK